MAGTKSETKISKLIAALRPYQPEKVYLFGSAAREEEDELSDLDLTASFLAQQAGQKALKSLLYYLGSRRTALLTHSFRYPNGLPSGYPHQFYGKELAEGALNAADMILAAVGDHYRTQGEEGILVGTG